MRSAVKKLAGDKRGFTLPEVLVTIMMLVVVLFALYSIFDMGIRVFSLGNDKLEATENARLGLEKMTREIRAAHAYDKANNSNSPPVTTDDHIFFNPSNPATPLAVSTTSYTFSQLTFGNDASTIGSSGHRKIECGASCEYITYKLTGPNSSTSPCTGAPCALMRNNTATGSTSTANDQPVVGYVKPNGLTFALLKSDGNPPANESQVGMVRIKLEISVSGDPPRTQTLTTDVALRNRSNP